ncbi:tagatose 1,6-diphosphate aldolase [Microvirga lotononidis]|uniref:Tagatose-1,6-bisphosphate aldolase n=1 Tax=Microvirga lotononidis TaxID=864069 RepID=I4Z135_9HYPH|nr:tagatose 1,6-diphosphate aldolase [Microvirga lotononidis]EIM29927.1 tagatose-1,6-bisphosphate aldolase [Microvirga lotononidis]WQO32011.1 tagatose 1,6-diphosphate aldolase [Microvirga lotononidis]
MTYSLSAGKFRSLRRLADANGRFKMMAADQRPPIIKAIDQKLGAGSASYDRVGSVKRALVKSLAPASSAVLIDPDYGYSQSYDIVPSSAGLLLTLEDFAFEESAGGRKTHLMKGWSVEKIRRAGADGVKLLLWYRPDVALDVREHQHRLVREVGAACKAHDLAFLLELLVYPFAGAADHTTDYIEHRDKRPELVLQSVRDFAGSEYGVDIYKLESPLAAGDLPDPRGSGPEVDAAQKWFDDMGVLIDKPWVMLSAGAGMEEFRRVLHYAFKAGANGFLAGRAIWWQSFLKAYPDVAAMEALLANEGANYLAEINAMTDSMARPWGEAPAFSGGITLKNAGQDFPSQYPSVAA